MTVDENCKREIISIIKSELNKVPFFLQGMAKSEAENKVNEFINSVPNTEYNIVLSDYIAKHPEVKNNYPQAARLLPDSVYKYTMQELIECLDEIKTRI